MANSMILKKEKGGEGMDGKKYSEETQITSKHFEILEKIGIVSKKEIKKKLENLAEKLEKSDAERVWIEGNENCQHEWSVEREIEGVNGQYRKICHFLKCERCNRTIFIDGWRHEIGGWDIKIEPNGSEGMAIPPE
jgi:hypothetical protein